MVLHPALLLSCTQCYRRSSEYSLIVNQDSQLEVAIWFCTFLLDLSFSAENSIDYGYPKK